LPDSIFIIDCFLLIFIKQIFIIYFKILKNPESRTGSRQFGHGIFPGSGFSGVPLGKSRSTIWQIPIPNPGPVFSDLPDSTKKTTTYTYTIYNIYQGLLIFQELLWRFCQNFFIKITRDQLIFNICSQSDLDQENTNFIIK
jgi:hypothetical protein